MAETFDLDKVVDILRDEHGVTAYVGQSGGGCATIYAGEPFDDDEGYVRYPVLAGPGYFDGPGWTNGKGWKTDFYIGPDDFGEADPIMTDDTWTEAQVASTIACEVDSQRKG